MNPELKKYIPLLESQKVITDCFASVSSLNPVIFLNEYPAPIAFPRII